MAVALFFTRNLGGSHLFHQHRSAAHDLFRREGQTAHALLQFLGICQQLVGKRGQALGALFDPKAVLDAVEAGEARVLLGLFMVVGTRIHALVQIGKQLGNRLDALVGAAHGSVHLLGLFDLAGLDRIGEGLHALDQLAQIVVDVQLVLRQRLDQLQRRHAFCCPAGQGDDAGTAGQQQALQELATHKHTRTPRLLD